jgi:hypothetical protein
MSPLPHRSKSKLSVSPKIASAIVSLHETNFLRRLSSSRKVALNKRNTEIPMRTIVIPPYLPLVSEMAIKNLDRRFVELREKNAGKFLLDKPVRRITRPKRK